MKRLVSYRSPEGVGCGLLDGEGIEQLSDSLDLGQLLQSVGPDLWQLPSKGSRPRSEVQLLAPIPQPGKVIGVGLNYADHAHEQKKIPPDHPIYFAKAHDCIVGPGVTIELPRDRHHIDVEVELVVVIGRRATEVSREDALSHVLGFTIGNDVSDRLAQKEDGQFYRAKSRATFGPTGPWIVSPHDFQHQNAPIRLWRSDFLQQDGVTSDLLFGVEHLISDLSHVHALNPGDLIFTGTPPGVGAHREPPLLLKSGDRIVCEIEGIGRLENPVHRSR
jgi:2-keto-4-pentenoate hydratase/2-oxohepta-3-ene-1,7-dioic acid hydratase in catechol pathway